MLLYLATGKWLSCLFSQLVPELAEKWVEFRRIEVHELAAIKASRHARRRPGLFQVKLVARPVVGPEQALQGLVAVAGKVVGGCLDSSQPCCRRHRRLCGVRLPSAKTPRTLALKP